MDKPYNPKLFDCFGNITSYCDTFVFSKSPFLWTRERDGTISSKIYPYVLSCLHKSTSFHFLRKQWIYLSRNLITNTFFPTKEAANFNASSSATARDNLTFITISRCCQTLSKPTGLAKVNAGLSTRYCFVQRQYSKTPRTAGSNKVPSEGKSIKYSGFKGHKQNIRHSLRVGIQSQGQLLTLRILMV